MREEPVEGGWTSVEELVRRARSGGRDLTRELVDEVVRTSEKQRLALSGDGSRIRANQGHSIDVDLGLGPAEPPPRLYHGTARRSLDSIMASGLEPRGRRHVHLSADIETAVRVGERHGRAVVLAVDARSMDTEGHTFFVSANGVWLVDAVPPEYLAVIDA
ncbi:MAG: RNA 2'-phosphotransferase [Planctomycetota bacterium]